MLQLCSRALEISRDAMTCCQCWDVMQDLIMRKEDIPLSGCLSICAHCHCASQDNAGVHSTSLRVIISCWLPEAM